MKYFTFALALIALSLVSCAPQQPIVYYDYHYRVVEERAPDQPSRPAPQPAASPQRAMTPSEYPVINSYDSQ